MKKRQVRLGRTCKNTVLTKLVPSRREVSWDNLSRKLSLGTVHQGVERKTNFYPPPRIFQILEPYQVSYQPATAVEDNQSSSKTGGTKEMSDTLTIGNETSCVLLHGQI